MLKTIFSSIGLSLHVMAGLCVVSVLGLIALRRYQTAADLEHRVAAGRAISQELDEKLRIQRNVLEGLRSRDPYVIELHARQRYGYAGDKEIEPPPVTQDLAPKH